MYVFYVCNVLVTNCCKMPNADMVTAYMNTYKCMCVVDMCNVTVSLYFCCCREVIFFVACVFRCISKPPKANDHQQ